MSKRSLRVHFVAHETGHVTGILLRTWDWFFDKPPPMAYGPDEEHVYDELEAQLHAMRATEDDSLERYLWDESFTLETLTVDVHPQTAVKKRLVIGKRSIPLRVTFLTSKVPSGGYRVIVPRFGFRFVLEDLSVTRDVLEQLIASALHGDQARALYDFRLLGEEYVRAWSPRMLRHTAEDEDEDFEELRTVKTVAEDLVDLAARGRLPPALGASSEMDALAPLVARDPAPSLLFVGGPGVGKTTLVHRLARHFLAQKRAKKSRTTPRIWGTTSDRLIAGMTYLGMWQERCLTIAQELSGEPDYLYVGALSPFLQPQSDGGSLAEMFDSALSADLMRLIAECTEAELERCERRAPSLLARFQIVRIAEPPASAMPAFITEVESRREATVRLHASGKKRLIEHLAMFRRDQRFPGKLVRFLDRLYQDAPASAPGKPPRVLYARDVSVEYAKKEGIPLEIVADEIPATAASLALRLGEAVIAQDGACAVAAKVLARFKAGMNDPDRPIGTLLFVGPTGVGKTELAKQLARTMFGTDEKMIRLDMSEYMLPGSAMRLLETGRGVTSLVERVRQEPLSLVLFDEIEKADAEVLDLLLGVLGEGRLSDDTGRLVDFRMTMIVMTSNLGASDAPPVGFGTPNLTEPTVDRKLRQHFRPELWNRLDYVVPFRALTPESMLRIVDLELDKARKRTGLVRRNLRIEVTPAARARLAELGYQPTRGARPLKRTIEEMVITPIAARMAGDVELRDRTLIVRREGDAIVVT
jgi:ATP-dependent Clp protease ATP-binding subunit ClpC